MRRRTYLATSLAVLAGCSEATTTPDGSDTRTRTPTRTATHTASGTPSPAESSTPEPTDTETPVPTAETLYGTSLSPRSFEGREFVAFLERVGELGGALRWAGDWAELGDPEGGPETTAGLADRYDLTPVIEVSLFDTATRELHRPLSAETRERYRTDAAAFAERHAPPFLGLGIEVDFLAEFRPGAFDTYVDLFAETAAAVHEVSPDTAVYPGFQHEHLRGLHGGLFGGVNDPDTASWGLLDRFPDADCLGVTTYPGLVYPEPSDVPADHYGPLADRVDRPVAVSEVGWSSETVAEGWESDEAEQAAYLDRWVEQVAPLDLAFACYAWMYDPADAGLAFEGMGLRRPDGTAKPAWDVWVERS